MEMNEGMKVNQEGAKQQQAEEEEEEKRGGSLTYVK